MSEENNLFIYVREDNGDQSSSIEKYPIVPFFPFVDLGEKFYWQTNDTCKLRIFWQGYFGLATEHDDDIPARWDGTRCTKLQSMETYNKLKEVISDKQNSENKKPALKNDIFPVRFLEFTPSFHRIIINFIGQRDNLAAALSDEPYDVNLTTEFIKDTGYDVEQLVAEKKIFHNEQLGDNTYVWFDNDCNASHYVRYAVKFLNYLFAKKAFNVEKALDKVNLNLDDEGFLSFSNKDNRDNIKSALEKANYIFESFDRIFDDYDDRIKDLRSDYSADEHKNFIHDFAEYLTFQSFCGNYMKLDVARQEPISTFYPQLYLIQLIFTQIMLDHIDKPSEIRKQIFDSIVKVRDYFLQRDLELLSLKKLNIGSYANELLSNSYLAHNEGYKFLCYYNPTENPIQYIVNSILPDGLKLYDKNFDLFLKHINYMYTALTNLSPEDSVTRLTLWTIPPDLDKKFGFMRDGVFCRPLFDVVEKYNSLQQDESAKIPITDLKPLPQNCRILTYEEYQQLTSAQNPEHSTSDLSTPSSLKTEISSDENIIEPVKRKCIKISGITLTTFGILALALGIAAQACSFGIPNPVSITLMAAGGTLIAAGSGMLIYRVCKNNQENNQALNFEIAHNNGNDIQDNDEQNLSYNDRQPFSERIENAQEQAQNLPQNLQGNPQVNLEQQTLQLKSKRCK